MSKMEVTIDQLNTLIDQRLQSVQEQHQRERRDGEATIRQLTERLDRLDIQMREERTRSEMEQARMRATIAQIKSDHQEEINTLTARYQRDRDAIVNDLNALRQENDGLRQENDGLRQENGDLRQTNDDLTRQNRECRRRNAELERDRLNQNIPVMVPGPNIPTHVDARDLTAVEKLTEFLKAEGNDAYWQKFFAGGEFTVGGIAIAGACLVSSKVLIILLAVVGTGIAIDSLRRFVAACYMDDHPHRD